MKIALFVHCFFPSHFYGTETYTLELAKNYQRVGHQVTVVTATFQGEPSLGDLLSTYEFQEIPVVCIDKNKLPHARVKETYYQPEMRDVLTQVLKQLNPDIVHVTHLINHTAALLEVTQALGIATYATFTDFFGFCLNNKLEAADGSLCAGPSISRTNCVACHLKAASHNKGVEKWARYAADPRIAQTMASVMNISRRLPTLRHGAMDGLVEDIARRPDTLASLYNNGYRAAVAPTKFLGTAYASNGIQVPLHNIQFGVDIDRNPKPPRTPGHKPVIGYIGQIAPHKGTDLLIEAFRRLPKNSASLQIYGPPDQDPIYMAQLAGLATGFDVQFMGTFAKEMMAEILGKMDLLVIPSRWYENSPLVLLNALATHTPVLVADVQGMTEFLAPGVNGYAFERGNVDHLYQQLKKVTLSPDDLFALSKSTHYEKTPQIMAIETMAIYKEL
jgi:glycosyltransferase involved in cell wall biosynthesis